MEYTIEITRLGIATRNLEEGGKEVYYPELS